MNQLVQSKNFTTIIVSAAAFLCIGLVPTTQAVSPAPDGGYPNGNTAEGDFALLVPAPATAQSPSGHPTITRTRARERQE